MEAAKTYKDRRKENHRSQSKETCMDEDVISLDPEEDLDFDKQKDANECKKRKSHSRSGLTSLKRVSTPGDDGYTSPAPWDETKGRAEQSPWSSKSQVHLGLSELYTEEEQGNWVELSPWETCPFGFLRQRQATSGTDAHHPGWATSSGMDAGTGLADADTPQGLVDDAEDDHAMYQPGTWHPRHCQQPQASS